jgi:hypothetical protein
MSITVPVKMLPSQGTQDLSAVLYTQAPIGANAIACQNFEAAFNGYDTQCADDFDIPAGDTWDINTVLIGGLFWNGGFQVQGADVYFVGDAAGQPDYPGNIICQYIDVPNENGQFVPMLDLNLQGHGGTCTLTTGHYWMVMYVNMAFGPNGQWGWFESTAHFFESHWRNSGGSFGICPVWSPRVTVCAVGTNPDHAYTLDDEGAGGDGDGDGDGSGGTCDLAPIEAKLDAAEVKLDNVQCNVDLTPIEAKLDAAEVKLDQGGGGGCDCCSIVNLLLPLLPGSPELPSTHACYNP